ncbi:BET1 [Phaffia rhodozyma]|uniref:BET1 n=1 Tax=Phaffia rhodozyma TaxID=264483 RepID=A0A0F7SER6_PHARH|nr:BET1 [Phaffia rhodozyma]
MPPRAGTSSDQIYESQNDEQLNDLHGKLRALRGVTTDIYNDAERQNLQLDQTANTFETFTTSFLRTTTNSARTFANSSGVKQYKLTLYIAGAFVGVFLLWKMGIAHWGREPEGPP